MESLEVLRCVKCDAPLVLVDRDQATCTSCGAMTDVPAPYRELYRARLADKTARADAEAVLRQLDRPPSMATKVLARTFDQNMFVFFLVYGIPVGIGAVMFALSMDVGIALAFHYPSADDVPFAFTGGLAVLAVFVCAFVPRALGVYANRRVADRTRLLAALAARPPTVAGAAAQCRICGAPLAVEKDAIVAVCAYCGAQNAVHLEMKVAAETTANATVVGSEMRAALERDTTERTATRRLMMHELRRYAIRTALLGGSFVLACQETPEHRPTTAGIIGIVATPLLLIFFMLRSMGASDEDADDRRAMNDVPSWVSWGGPLIVLALLYGMC